MAIWKNTVSDIAGDVPRIEWTGTQQIRVESHRGLTRFAPNVIEMAASLGRLVIQRGKGMTVRSLTTDDATVEGHVLHVTCGGRTDKVPVDFHYPSTW